jgi:hypothetical protein
LIEKQRYGMVYYTERVKHNLIGLYEEIKTEVFGYSQVAGTLGCSGVTATSYIRKLFEELKLIVPVEGAGKGKFRFISEKEKTDGLAVTWFRQYAAGKEKDVPDDKGTGLGSVSNSPVSPADGPAGAFCAD